MYKRQDYTKSLGLHNLGAMIGYSYQDDDAKGIYQWAKDFPTDMFGPWNIGSIGIFVRTEISFGNEKCRTGS